MILTNLGEIKAASSLMGLGSGVMVKEAEAVEVSTAGMGAEPEAEGAEGERGGVMEAGSEGGGEAEGLRVRGPLSRTVL